MAATEKTHLLKTTLPSKNNEEKTSSSTLPQHLSSKRSWSRTKLRCCNHSAQTRRRFLYGTIGVFVFLTGVEYAVILPTMWLYISDEFGASSSFLGLCISAFSISALMFCPVFGYLNDWTRDTKTLIIICNCFEIVGNILYLFRVEWLVFVARFTAGVGAAASPILFADVGRATRPEHRTAVLSAIILCRQIGLFIGPAFNLFLSQMDFYIGPVHVDAYTAPGFVMTILWILHQIQVVFTFYNIGEYAEVVYSSEKPVKVEPSGPQSRVRWDACKSPTSFQVTQALSPCLSPTFVDPKADEQKDENYCLRKSESQKDKYPERDKPSAAITKEAVPWSVYWDEYSQESVIVFLGMSFLIFFAQTSLESMLTPLTERLFHWGELENSGIFAVAGGIVLCVCLAVAVASKRFNDRNMTLVGLLMMLISLIWSTSTLPGGYYGKPWLLFHFVVSTALSVGGCSATSVTSYSLFSKCITDRTQGFGAGLRRGIVNMGLILGPLWSGAMIDRLNIMLGVNLGLVCLVFVLYLTSWKAMLPQGGSRTAVAEDV